MKKEKHGGGGGTRSELGSDVSVKEARPFGCAQAGCGHTPPLRHRRCDSHQKIPHLAKKARCGAPHLFMVSAPSKGGLEQLGGGIPGKIPRWPARQECCLPSGNAERREHRRWPGERRMPGERCFAVAISPDGTCQRIDKERGQNPSPAVSERNSEIRTTALPDPVMGPSHARVHNPVPAGDSQGGDERECDHAEERGKLGAATDGASHHPGWDRSS
jgi:hypothetical protein